MAYAQLSATTGAPTLLPRSPTALQQIVGQELSNGVGTSIGTDDQDGTGPYLVFNWNPTSGAESAGVVPYVTGADEGSLFVRALDTRNDGTLITYVEYSISDGDPIDYAAIATLNRTTGELTPVIDVLPLLVDYRVISLATDPLTGTTYAFLGTLESSFSFYVTLNFVVPGYTPPTQFEGTGFEDGFFQGADFDAEGTLWFIYGNNLEEQYELSTLGLPSGWPTAARNFVAEAAPGTALATLALATGPAPALANTGAEFPSALLALGTVAVLGGVVAVTTVSRRRRVA